MIIRFECEILSWKEWEGENEEEKREEERREKRREEEGRERGRRNGKRKWWRSPKGRGGGRGAGREEESWQLATKQVAWEYSKTDHPLAPSSASPTCQLVPHM